MFAKTRLQEEQLRLQATIEAATPRMVGTGQGTTCCRLIGPSVPFCLGIQAPGESRDNYHYQRLQVDKLPFHRLNDIDHGILPSYLELPYIPHPNIERLVLKTIFLE